MRGHWRNDEETNRFRSGEEVKGKGFIGSWQHPGHGASGTANGSPHSP